MNKLIEAHLKTIDRLKKQIVDSTLQREDTISILKFCDTAHTITNPDKLSRWVGFVQGFMFANGILDINEERNVTRPLYKPIYDAMGYDSSTVEAKEAKPAEVAVPTYRFVKVTKRIVDDGQEHHPACELAKVGDIVHVVTGLTNHLVVRHLRSVDATEFVVFNDEWEEVDYITTEAASEFMEDDYSSLTLQHWIEIIEAERETETLILQGR